MPTNEKEYNGYLFDQLSLIEEITEVAEKEHATETLAILEKKKKTGGTQALPAATITAKLNSIDRKMPLSHLMR